MHDAGYPHLAVTALTDRAPELGKRWPNSFWLLGTMTGAAQGFVDTLAKLRSEGKIGNKVAMVSVADQFGIGLAKAARRALKKSGFDLVYDRSYTVEAQDMRDDHDRGEAATTRISFLAFSYPPDTMAITEQARASNFNPKVFYTAVGTAFPLYKQRFGADVEGVMGIGGWNPDTPESKDYLKRHMAADRPGAGPLGEPDNLCVSANAAAGDRACRQDRSRGGDQGIADRDVSKPSSDRSS